MKTVKQWFEELPDGYRERALKAMTHPDFEAESIKEAVAIGINDWHSTIEGVEFWAVVYDYHVAKQILDLELSKLTKD